MTWRDDMNAAALRWLQAQSGYVASAKYVTAVYADVEDWHGDTDAGFHQSFGLNIEFEGAQPSFNGKTNGIYRVESPEELFWFWQVVVGDHET